MAATELDMPDHTDIPANNSDITQQQAGSSGQGLLSQDTDNFISIKTAKLYNICSYLSFQ